MKRSVPLRLEHLEDRTTPATFGIPWNDPTHLTISFVPDGTDVSGTPSTLFQKLNSLTATWQNDILRAAQAWASVANVNIGLTSDNGAPMGTPTPLDGSAGFGTIRVVAKPMANNVLAVGIPPNEFDASSWAGDIIFNSNANLTAQKTDLYTVFLHEIGHALGIPGSTDIRSVMFQKIQGKRLGLASADVVSVSTMYGSRLPDLNETPGKGNDSIKLATRLKYEDDPANPWTGSVPLVAFGDITRGSDIDVFSYQNLPDYTGPISVRLLSQGISLLNPKVSVLDANGKVITSRLSQQVGGSDLLVTLPTSTAGAKYFIRVEAANAVSPFSVGRYAMALTLDSRLTTAPGAINRVLAGPYESFATDDVDELFNDDLQESLFHQDDSTDDVAGNASRLASANSLATVFNVVGSLQENTDVDFYRVRVPRLTLTTQTNLTMTVTPYAINGVMPDIQLFDKSNKPVPYNVLSNGNGVMVIQATGLKPNDDYFVRLANAPGQNSVGNYQANLRFGKSATTLQTFFAGTIAASGTTSTLYVADPQFFHLLLATTNGTSATMTIENLAGTALYTLTSNGPPASGKPVLLQPGEYRIRWTTTGQSANVILRGDSISDPIGSVVVDPNQAPLYPTPGQPGTNTYPNGTITNKPYLWISLTL